MKRTFAIIKPDAVSAGHVGSILQRIEEAGFSLVALRLVQLTKADAEGFYAVHRERSFFDTLTTFMASGPVVVLALEAPDAIVKWRSLMGDTDPGARLSKTLHTGLTDLRLRRSNSATSFLRSNWVEWFVRRNA